MLKGHPPKNIYNQGYKDMKINCQRLTGREGKPDFNGMDLKELKRRMSAFGMKSGSKVTLIWETVLFSSGKKCCSYQNLLQNYQTDASGCHLCEVLLASLFCYRISRRRMLVPGTIPFRRGRGQWEIAHLNPTTPSCSLHPAPYTLHPKS